MDDLETHYSRNLAPLINQQINQAPDGENEDVYNAWQLLVEEFLNSFPSARKIVDLSKQAGVERGTVSRLFR